MIKKFVHPFCVHFISFELQRTKKSCLKSSDAKIKREIQCDFRMRLHIKEDLGCMHL